MQIQTNMKVVPTEQVEKAVAKELEDDDKEKEQKLLDTLASGGSSGEPSDNNQDGEAV